MASALPFSALLDVLRARGLPIGLPDYRDLALLLSRYDGCSHHELRTAIGALLGRDRIERSLIADCFDELYLRLEAPPTPLGEPERPPPPVSESTTRTKIGWRDAILRRIFDSPWISGGIVVIVLSVAVLAGPILQTLVSSPSVPPLPLSPPKDLPVALTPPGEAAPPVVPPKPEEPQPVPRLEWTTVVGPTAIAFGAILVLRIGRRWTIRRWSLLRSARRAQLASLSGPRFYRWRVDDRVGAIPRAVVEDVATILGRRHEVARTGRHLHVNSTIRRTLESGLFPRLVYEPPCRTLPLLVLQDVGADMRPWRRRIYWLVRDLERLGVPVSCWYFDVSASQIWRTPSDPGTTLEALARLADDAALMIVSAGAGVRAALADPPDRSWIRLLPKWPARTWVTPLTSRAHWRPELAAVPCSVWPMTPGGLHAAARELLLDGTHRPTAAADALAGARAVGRDDLERVKRLVALVPPPAPVDLVEALRVRFTPDVPPDVVLPLLAENESLDSSAVRLRDGEVKRLLAAIRRDNPDREVEVRRFLLGLLDASEPSRDSAAYLRWQTDRALHQAIVAELAGREQSDAVAQLQTLADGPLSDEVRTRTAQVTRTGRLTDLLSRVRLWPPPLTPENGGAAASPPVWLKASDALVAVAGAAVAAGLLAAVGGVDRVQVDHVRDAWTLTWQPANQTLAVARVSPDAPRSGVALLRDGARLASVSLTGAAGEVVRSRLAERGETGSWYQLQAPLRNGNLALSNAVFVPGPVRPGQLLATFRSSQGPLPDVSFTLYGTDGRSLAGLAGRPIDLQPGLWTIVAQPQGYQALDQPITVRAGVTLRQEFTLTSAAASVLTAAVQLELKDVYGGAPQGPLSVGFLHNGQPVKPSGAVPPPSGVQTYQFLWSVIGQAAAPGSVEVRVTSSYYQPAVFRAVGKPGGVTLLRGTLVFEPRRVQPSFTTDPREVSTLLGKQRLCVPGSPAVHANLLNIFSRARTAVVTLERPQGTFSRDLWSMLDTCETVTATNMVASVAGDVAAYLETWMRLATTGAVNKSPVNAQQNAQQNVQQNVQQQRVPRGPITLSIPPKGRDRVFLDLEFQPGLPSGQSGNRLTLSLRSAAFSNPDPYLIHQALVQGGYPALYRLRPISAAMAK